MANQSEFNHWEKLMPKPKEPFPRDPTLVALADLAKALEIRAHDQAVLAVRIGRLRAARADGARWDQLLSDDPGEGSMQSVSHMVTDMSEAGGAFRRAVVQELRHEGVSLSIIAKLFGVTHQRVSNILHRSGE